MKLTKAIENAALDASHATTRGFITAPRKRLASAPASP
jgi:hypothetical protein